MRLKNIGEFGWIEEIRKRTARHASVRVGIGDDAALLKGFGSGEILFTTDLLAEGTHFRLGKAAPFEIGWKAMAVNLSDIAAMGGRPRYAVVAAAFPADCRLRFMREMDRGLRTAAAKFGVQIVGGDTNRSDRIVISVAMIGEAGRRTVRRSGARAGDVLFVTGTLGRSYETRKHLRFTPRLREAKFLLSKINVRAMIDVSDGLAADLRRLCRASHTGAHLSREALPVTPGAGLTQALTEGEDFELLFAVSPADAGVLAGLPRPKGLAPIRAIGKMVSKKEGFRLIRDDGASEPLPDAGFDHFHD